MYPFHFEKIVQSYARKRDAEAALRVYGLHGLWHSGSQTLLRWSGTVDTKFEEDNLHLTGRWIFESKFRLMATVRSELAEGRANQLTL